MIRVTLQAVWGVYALVVFGVIVVMAMIGFILVPGQQRRDHVARGAARAVFRLAGVRITVNGIENLPDEHCVVVANHVSYADGPLLKGVLPAPYSFVIKGEMRSIPVVHFFLRRGGARFVERHEASGSARDARAIVKAASSGQPLAVFPEGTFRLEEGVGRFRAGAFVAAVRADMPVVPAAIQGTRHILPIGRFLPRPGPITVDILEPIMPDDDAVADARQVAETSRQRIIAQLGEPDLLA